MNNINNIFVLGGGTMGNGIAHTFAQYGFPVSLYDVKQEFLDKAIKTISGNLELKKDIFRKIFLNFFSKNLARYCFKQYILLAFLLYGFSCSQFFAVLPAVRKVTQVKWKLSPPFVAACAENRTTRLFLF